MANILAVLDEGAYNALPDTTTLGKDAFTKNDEKKQFFLNISPDEAEKVAFNLQTKFENKKTELEKVHKAKNEAEAKLKTFESLGKSADELKQVLETNRPEEVTKLVEKYETEKTSLKTSYEEALATEKTRAEARERELKRTLTESAIAKLRLEHDLNDTADFVLRDFIRVEPKEEGSDEFTTRVYENGTPALLAGQPKTPEQLVKGFKEEKKYLSMFNAPNGGGTGATNNQKNLNGKQTEGLSPTEKMNAAWT